MFKKGNLIQAISDFSKVIDIDPNFVRAYFSRGVAYFQTKEYDKAWADVHKAESLGIKTNPQFIEALKKASGRDK